MTNSQVLDQENLEINILQNTPNILHFSLEEIYNLGIIGEGIYQNKYIIENGLDIETILNILPYSREDLEYNETIDYYINKLNDLPGYNILGDMKNWNKDIYMKYTHQKTFVKGYFVPLLRQIFDFCDEEGYTNMTYAMLYNIKDESGEWQNSKKGNIYSKKGYNHIIIKEGEEYKLEPHFMRRKYEYNGLIREYGKAIEDGRNSGVKIFNYLLGKLLTDNSRKGKFMKIGAIAAAEKIIPDEYIYMKSARDRLFPGLNNKERHYINDHIKHDIEYHFQDIIKGMREIKATNEEKSWIEEGMHLFYIGRATIYSSFRKQIYN